MPLKTSALTLMGSSDSARIHSSTDLSLALDPVAHAACANYTSLTESSFSVFSRPWRIYDFLRFHFHFTLVQGPRALLPMRKDQADVNNSIVHIPDSKTENGVADMPMTDLARDTFQLQMQAKCGRSLCHTDAPAGRRCRV